MMGNPWEALATGVLLPEPRKSTPGHLARAKRSREKQQMKAHGVTTLAELHTRQVLTDNTKPRGFNQPVGKGFKYRAMASQPCAPKEGVE